MNKKIEISKILIRNPRNMSAKKIEELKESISKVGLLQPIGINSNNELIFGHHRLEACKRLGWREIDFVRVSSPNEIIAELASIDENLIRKELSHIQKADMIARRKEIFEMLYTKNQKTNPDTNSDLDELNLASVSQPYPNSASVLQDPVTTITDSNVPYYDASDSPKSDATPTPEKPKRRGRPSHKSITEREFIAEISKLGISENLVRQSIIIARHITPLLKETIVDHPFAYSMRALLELARLSPNKQRQIIPFIKSGEIKDARDIRRFRHRLTVAVDKLIEEKIYDVVVFRPPHLIMKYIDMSFIDLQAKNDAVLFVFSEEFNMMPCMVLISNFGFIYKRTFVLQREPVDNVPVKSSTQFVLMGIRGEPEIGSLPDHTNLLKNEDEFYSMIDAIVKEDAKKVEFFPPPHLHSRPKWKTITAGMITSDPEDIEIETIDSDKDDVLLEAIKSLK